MIARGGGERGRVGENEGVCEIWGGKERERERERERDGGVIVLLGCTILSY